MMIIYCSSCFGISVSPCAQAKIEDTSLRLSDTVNRYLISDTWFFSLSAPDKLKKKASSVRQEDGHSGHSWLKRLQQLPVLKRTSTPGLRGRALLALLAHSAMN